MKTLETFRLGQQKKYGEYFGAAALCVSGLLAMPALLFNPGTLSRAGQFLFFWLLCFLGGKKNNFPMTILVILGIILFNLAVPFGRVLFSAGIFKITQGALMLGIHRAATLEGLIMLSRISIRRDLRIPGGFGELIGESFRCYALLADSRQRVTIKNLLKDIDQLLIELSDEKSIPSNTGGDTQKTRPLGFAILVILVILAWIPAFIELLMQSA